MARANVKQQVRELVDQLPENATWDDVVYQMVVRREIEKGLADSDADRVTPVEDVMKEFGMTE
jgi:predicted transcriptional regulator